MVSNKQILEVKQDLVTRQNALIKQVKDHYGTSFEMAEESTGDLSHYDNHPADLGTEQFERGKDAALNEHSEKELEEINEALHAIEEGTYGICTECGKDISFARLKAVPTTDRCLDHANKDIFKHNRPVEEQVFSPNINPDEVTEETQVGYDSEDAWQEVGKYGTSETASDFYGDRDNYDEMYPNSDELVGSVEDVEEFLGADSKGKFTGVTPNHKKYEKRLDNE